MKLQHLAIATAITVSIIIILLLTNNKSTEVESVEIAVAKTFADTALKLKAATTASIEELIIKKNQRKYAQCENYLKPINDIASFKKTSRTLFKEFLINLQEKGIDETKIDHISKISGIGVYQGRLLRSGTSTGTNLAKFMHKDAQPLSSKAKYTFLYHFIRKDFSGLVTAYRNGDIDKSGYITTLHGKKSAIGQIISATGGKQFEYVEQLVQLGVEITYQDLATATTEYMPLDKVRHLYAASALSATKVFTRFGEMNSLALTATIANNAAMVGFWLREGSLASPDIFSKNALDLIKVPHDKTDKEQKLAIFMELMNYNIRPNNKHTFDRLKSWLPSHLLAQYGATLQNINSNKVPRDSLREVIGEVFHIHQRLLSDQVTVVGSNFPTHQCFKMAALQLTSLVLVKQDPNFSLVSVVKPDNFKIKAKQRLDEVKGLYTDVESIESALGESQDMVGKLALRKFRIEQMELALEEGRARSRLEVDPAIREALVKAIERISLGDAKDGQQQLNDLYDSLKDQPELANGVLDSMLVAELAGRGDYSAIKDLITRGAVLPVHAVLTLVQRNNIKLAKQLLKHGLDLHIVDPTGQNALTYSVSIGSQDMVSFLIKNGVAFKPTRAGLDALDKALAQLSSFSYNMNIISLLIEGGALVELSHKEKTLSYKRIKPTIYELLIERFPSLRM